MAIVLIEIDEPFAEGFQNSRGEIGGASIVFLGDTETWQIEIIQNIRPIVAWIVGLLQMQIAERLFILHLRVP